MICSCMKLAENIFNMLYSTEKQQQHMGLEGDESELIRVNFHIWMSYPFKLFTLTPPYPIRAQGHAGGHRTVILPSQCIPIDVV